MREWPMGVIVSTMSPIKLLTGLVSALMLAGLVAGASTAYCSDCDAVDCRADYDCGDRCECVKRNKYKHYEGQCVQLW